MAIINGTSIDFTSTVTDDATRELLSPIDIATATVGGTAYVYVAGFNDNGIEVLTLNGNGILSSVGRVVDSSLTALNGVYGLQTFSVGGNQFLAAVGRVDNGLSVFSLSGSTPYVALTDSAFQTANANYNLTLAISVEAVTTSGGTFLYVAGRNSNGVSVFSVSAAGTLTNVQNLDDDFALQLDGANSVSHFKRGSTDYVAVMGDADNGVSIFSINATTGALTSVANLVLAITPASDDEITVASVAGRTFLYATSYSQDSIQVLEFNGSSITSLQTITNTALDGAIGVSVINHGDRPLLAVSNYNSGSVTVYEISTDPFAAPGSLTPLQLIKDNAGEGELTSAIRTDTVVVGGKTFLLASAYGGSAINAYEIGGGDDDLHGTNAADTMNGLGGSDHLYGLGGVDQINGGDGDDVIYGGSGGDGLGGNAGDDVIYGEDGIDYIYGQDGSDQLFGGSDSDYLYGDVGGDQLFGDSGADFLFGGAGSDTLEGGTGVDQMQGEAGDDTLRGGDDGDGLGGGAGDDTLLGEAGVDYLYGEDGSDVLRGGSDGDFMYGGNLRDQLDGGDGADIINGGADYDWMWGNFGADSFHFAGYSYHDFIMDFVDGEDKISLQGEGWGYTDVSQISISNDGNGNVFISLGYQSWITVYNTSAAQLTNADFVF